MSLSVKPQLNYELQLATNGNSKPLSISGCLLPLGTKESKVTGRNSRDWKKKKKETKLKYFQPAQIVKTPLCGTTWWAAQHVTVIVKQGKIIIYNHSCVIWIDNNDNLHPSFYQKLAYGANPMSFFSMYASRHLFSFGTTFALPLGLKAVEVPSLMKP